MPLAGAQQRRLRAVEVEDLAQPVLVLGHASIRAARPARQMQILQPVQSLAHRFFVQVRHRLAVRALVAGIDQRVQRERIVVRRRDFLFNQSAQHACLGEGEQDGLGRWHT